VRTGQRLRVGGSSHAATAVRIASSADAAERRSHAKGGGSDAARAATRTHKVRKGDTLTGIAQRYGVSTSAIKSANRMSGSTVKVGQTLRIPAKL
jgi:LysM repeat protein